MLVFVLFCFLSFVVICLFISCFLLFCFFYYFCYFVTWYTKRNTLLKFSKGNALNEALKLNGVCCLLRDSFFSVYRHGGNFPTAMIKKQVPFLLFFIQRFNILKIEQTFGNHVLSGQLYGKLGDFISLSNGMRFFYIRKNFHGTSGVIDMLF